MIRLTVRRRIILLLLAVSLIPLATSNIIWLLSSQATLRNTAASQQAISVKSSADAVTYFINNKVDDAIIHSQTTAVQSLQIPNASSELDSYLKQDADLTSVTLVDSKGLQKLQVGRDGVSTSVVDVSASDTFRVVNFLGGEVYFSPVTFDSSHEPHMQIALPLINYATTQASNALTTAQSGVILQPSDIKGALIVDIALKRLWDSVLSDQPGQSGYAYVVDYQGNLLAYPKDNFGIKNRNFSNVPEVKTALSETQVPGASAPSPKPRETISETNVHVLSSHERISRTGWIVVTEDPIASVYAPVNNEEAIATIFFAISALLGLMLIVLTARSLLRPIQALTDGASQFGLGYLSYRIIWPKHDEFGMLAKTFNKMAAKISADITKLQEVDKLKNEFIMIASDNLRTPLTVIRSYIDLMRDTTLAPNIREMLTSMENSAQELLRFDEDMITISTIEAGKANLEISSIRCGELLSPLRSQYDILAGKKNLTMVWNVPDEQTQVWLSPVHIRSALSNLLGNAIEYSGPGNKVVFTFSVLPEKYIITVADSGSGIEPLELKKLFTKFHRGTSMLRYDHRGTGIGLYVTRLIAEAHHGEVEVESEVGHGSTFTITLPAQTTPSTRPAESDHNAQQK